MKLILPIAFLFSILTLASCHKDNGTGPSQLAGTWNVVSDSTYADVGASAGSGNKYTGKPGDYFKFSGNALTIKEGSYRAATATYTVVKDTLKIGYSYLNNDGYTVITPATDEYIIDNISSTSLQLREYSLPTPGGVFREYISLSR